LTNIFNCVIIHKKYIYTKEYIIKTITKKFFLLDNSFKNLVNKSKIERINKKAAILLEYRNFLSNEIYEYIKCFKSLNGLSKFDLINKYANKLENVTFFIKNKEYQKYINAKDLEENVKVVYSNYANKIDGIKNIEKVKITKNKRTGKFKTLQCILSQENIYYKKIVRSKVDKHLVIHNKGDFKERKYNNL
jgi:hypothetical protein